MIKTVLLDDDPLSRDAAQAALSQYPQIEITGRFSSGEELFQSLKEQSADLLFLDIELDGETGFSIAGRMKEEYPEVMIVFLTGHSTYAIDGYDFSPLIFLVKPINPVKLSQTIDEVVRRKENTAKVISDAKIMLHIKSGLKMVKVSDIRCFERRSRKIYMIGVSGEEQVSGCTLHELESMLERYGFFGCHQSVLVSVGHITAIRDARRQLYELTLQDVDKPLPVSRHKYNELLKRVKEYGFLKS